IFPTSAEAQEVVSLMVATMLLLANWRAQSTALPGSAPSLQVVSSMQCPPTPARLLLNASTDTSAAVTWSPRSSTGLSHEVMRPTSIGASFLSHFPSLGSSAELFWPGADCGAAAAGAASAVASTPTA